MSAFDMDFILELVIDSNNDDSRKIHDWQYLPGVAWRQKSPDWITTQTWNNKIPNQYESQSLFLTGLNGNIMWES